MSRDNLLAARMVRDKVSDIVHFVVDGHILLFTNDAIFVCL